MLGKDGAFFYYYMHTVLVLENLKTFSSAYFSILLRHNCSCLSIDAIFFDAQVMDKSSTKRDFSKQEGIMLAMLLIFKINKVTGSILPWKTPIS